jgi:hypothetical protein
MSTTATPPWVCPNCRASVATPFCAQCGERPIKRADLTVRGVIDRVVHALTSVDGRVLRTFGRLLRHPGALTRAYVDGQRKPWAPPFQLFLIANVLFFAVQSLTGINVLGASLDSHLHHQDWQTLAQSLLDRHLQATHTSQTQYAPLFDRAVVLHAKSLVILMVLPFSAVLALIFAGQGRRLMEHVAFALHLFTFLMVLFSLAVLGVRISMWLGGAGLEANWLDKTVSVVNLAACAVYVFLALGTAYDARGGARWARTFVLTLAALAIVLGYRFAIFLITLYST